MRAGDGEHPVNANPVEKAHDVARHVVDGEIAIVPAILSVAAPVERQHSVTSGESRYDLFEHSVIFVPPRQKQDRRAFSHIAKADRVSVDLDRRHRGLPFPFVMQPLDAGENQLWKRIEIRTRRQLKSSLHKADGDSKQHPSARRPAAYFLPPPAHRCRFELDRGHQEMKPRPHSVQIRGWLCGTSLL